MTAKEFKDWYESLSGYPSIGQSLAKELLLRAMMDSTAVSLSEVRYNVVAQYKEPYSHLAM